FQSHLAQRYLHSFPTRRSSDLTLSHYEICSVLGEGGMGKVYLAEDRKLRRKVALKVLPTANSGDEEACRRLLREAQARYTLPMRSEEHTSELQSPYDLVCRLLL